MAVLITNVGKTPALVLRSCLVYVHIPKLEMLPEEPEYFAPLTYDGNILPPNGKPIGHIVDLRPDAHLSEFEVRAIQNRNAFLYIYGFVEYSDTVGGQNVYVTRFGYVYNFPKGTEPEFLVGLIPAGPKAYNQAT